MPTHRDLTTLWTKTSAASAPTDTTTPTADSETSDANGVRGSRFVIELDGIVTSSTATAVVDLYLWDPRRPAWTKSDVSITMQFSGTSRGPDSRRTYEIDNIAPYGAVCPVLASITGSIGASLICRCAAR
jgi:hypothetical protein